MTQNEEQLLKKFERKIMWTLFGPVSDQYDGTDASLSSLMQLYGESDMARYIKSKAANQ